MRMALCQAGDQLALLSLLIEFPQWDQEAEALLSHP